MERRRSVTTVLNLLTSLMTSFLSNVCLCWFSIDHNEPTNNGLLWRNTHKHTHTEINERKLSALRYRTSSDIYSQCRSPGSWAASSWGSQPGGCQGGLLWRCTWGLGSLWRPGRREAPRGRQQESCNPGARQRGCGPAGWSGWCRAASSVAQTQTFWEDCWDDLKNYSLTEPNNLQVHTRSVNQVLISYRDTQPRKKDDVQAVCDDPDWGQCHHRLQQLLITLLCFIVFLSDVIYINVFKCFECWITCTCTKVSIDEQHIILLKE